MSQVSATDHFSAVVAFGLRWPRGQWSGQAFVGKRPAPRPEPVAPSAVENQDDAIDVEFSASGSNAAPRDQQPAATYYVDASATQLALAPQPVEAAQAAADPLLLTYVPSRSAAAPKLLYATHTKGRYLNAIA